jgi:hypothetical protein
MFEVASAEEITPPEGKQFKQWNTSRDGNGQAYAPGLTFLIRTSDVTLYTIWEDIAASDGNSSESGSEPGPGPGSEPKPEAADSCLVILISGRGYFFSTDEGPILQASYTDHVSYGGSYSFKLYADEGYDTSTLTVNVNGYPITSEDGVYNIDNITDMKIISAYIEKYDGVYSENTKVISSGWDWWWLIILIFVVSVITVLWIRHHEKKKRDLDSDNPTTPKGA